MKNLAVETTAVSLFYLVASFITFAVVMPVQQSLFPGLENKASLLFLPHGVKVLSAWLLGWRSSLALFPGVLAVFAYFAGWGVFEPHRMAAVLSAVLVPAAVFHVSKKLGWDLSPKAGRRPRWAIIMIVGLLISVVSSVLSNLAYGNAPKNYVAYLIGDFFGLFFLCLILMFLFRAWRSMAPLSEQ
ncbi:hypothetical protein [Phycobacter sp. K97]|uniref:hypothetical protein n=1 Tax=Phycobacter sedimenti TaxID=3133977 RepID=UPI00311EC88F